jgi:hypothetical protein
MSDELLKLQQSLVNVGLSEFEAFKKANDSITNTPEPISVLDNTNNEETLYQIFLKFSMVAVAFLLVAYSG